MLSIREVLAVGYRKRSPFIFTLLITVVLLATACGDSIAPASPEPATKPSTVPAAAALGSGVADPALSLAKGQNPKFERISVEHGLSHSTVNCILQDSKGFMWFGTDDGLNRYDGYSFTVYKHDPDDPRSLSHNQIWSLFEDSSGVLWVGTYGGGLNRFDRDSGRFTHYDAEDFQNVTDEPEEFRNVVWAIDEHPAGVLWIATYEGGLVKFDLDFPELGLIVVFTNEWTPGSGNAMQNLALLSEYVLPAALPADASVLLLWAWPILTGLSLLGLLWNLARSRPTPLAVWFSWVWIVLIFGPLGFAVYRVPHRETKSSRANWRSALGATLSCASGDGAGFYLLFALITLFQPQGDLLLLALVFPLLVGWLIFRAPMFAHQTGGGYLFALRRTLLTEVITTILVLAGLLPVIILLQFRWFPLGNLNVMNPMFWLMVSLAAMAGVLFAYPFNYWMARRGFLSWPARIAVDGEAWQAMPSLRSAWWALLLSIVFLIASLGLTVQGIS